MADVKVFHGRPVIPGQVTAPALVTHNGFNTLASFQKALLAKKTDAICSDQNNIELFNKKMAGTALCLPQTIGSTTGGLVLHTACDMGANLSLIHIFHLCNYFLMLSLSVLLKLRKYLY